MHLPLHLTAGTSSPHCMHLPLHLTACTYLFTSLQAPLHLTASTCLLEHVFMLLSGLMLSHRILCPSHFCEIAENLEITHSYGSFYVSKLNIYCSLIVWPDDLVKESEDDEKCCFKCCCLVADIGMCCCQHWGVLVLHYASFWWWLSLDECGDFCYNVTVHMIMTLLTDLIKMMMTVTPLCCCRLPGHSSAAGWDCGRVSGHRGCHISAHGLCYQLHEHASPCQQGRLSLHNDTGQAVIT